VIRQRLTTWGTVCLACCALAAWQYHEYHHEREAARETLRRQAEAVTNALVSGIRSHRRLGPFFEDQAQGMLDELVKPSDVLAAVLASTQGRLLLAAGKSPLFPQSGPLQPGEYWDADVASVLRGRQRCVSPLPREPSRPRRATCAN